MSGNPQPPPVVVRQYGRDSLLVWANVLLAPLFAALRLRVGLRSEERLQAHIEADVAAMRRKGYLVAATETFSLPVLGSAEHAAHWYRIRYERPSPGSEPDASPAPGG
jgi:hypothetical protein